MFFRRGTFREARLAHGRPGCPHGALSLLLLFLLLLFLLLFLMFLGVAVAVGLVVVAVMLLAVLVLCVVLYRERNGSTIYVKNFPTVLFLVKEIAKLERERFVFCPRLFWEEGARRDDQAELQRKNP